MSRTLVLMLGVWAMASPAAQADDKPEALAMPRPAVAATPLSEKAAAPDSRSEALTMPQAASSAKPRNEEETTSNSSSEPLAVPRPAVSDTPLGYMETSPDCSRSKCRRQAVRSCLGRLRDWICYHSPERTVKNDKCVSCCRPPLYTFFLHHCASCAEDNQGGIPITFNYNSLLENEGDCHHSRGGCRGCK